MVINTMVSESASVEIVKVMELWSSLSLASIARIVQGERVLAPPRAVRASAPRQPSKLEPRNVVRELAVHELAGSDGTIKRLALRLKELFLGEL